MNNYRYEIPSDIIEGAEVYVYESREGFIDEANINKHIQELPAQLGLWNAVLAKYNRALTTANIENDLWMANNKTEVRRALNDKGTESKVTEHVITTKNDEYLKLQKRLADLQYYIDLIKSIVKALDAKRDMLITFGANLRAEMASGVTINS